MANHISGIDHLVILVADLDVASTTYERLGFTVSPRGFHSAHMGTANHTIMFQDDYLELLSVLTPTPVNAPMRARLEEGEGLMATILKTDDATGAQHQMDAAGVTVLEPVAFERPVSRPDGGTGRAAFRITRIDEPGGPREGMFACEHLTRDTVWLPDLMTHANGATGLLAVTGVAEDPDVAAETLAILFDTEPVTAADGVITVDAAGCIVTVSRGETGHAGRALRLTGVTLGVDDLDRTRGALSDVRHQDFGGSLQVPPTETHGLNLTFKTGT
ncbi:MAG: VOC family protein [Pseudomonadota bacterium]